MESTLRSSEVRQSVVPTITMSELAIITFAKLGLNVAYRVVYPLLPFLASQLQVSLQMVSLLISVQVGASLLSPMSGWLSGRVGDRGTMISGLVSFLLGSSICLMASAFNGFMLGYLFIGLGVALFQPASQAYLSARTPYERRGRVLGLIELSWAAAAFVGVAPLMYLVQQTQRTTPVLVVLVLVAAAALALLFWRLPDIQRMRNSTPQPFQWSVLRMPRVAALLMLMGLALFAVDLILVVHSMWLQQAFGATEAQLGSLFGWMGVVEVIGAMGATLFVDRIGKKRAVLVGFTATALMMALLPFSTGSWALFLVVFLAFDMAFEFSIVSGFPLASGLAPSARSTVMAVLTGVIGLGRLIGSFVAGPLWQQAGIGANAWLAAGMTMVGVLIGFFFIQETERGTHEA